jgi:flagellar hook assembly protein FlgD
MISNSLGVVLRTMDEGERAAGHHSLQWDGRDDAGRPLPSGLYFYTLHAGSAVQTRMLQVLR